MSSENSRVVEIDVEQLLAPEHAARQEAALEHAISALCLIDELLALAEVRDEHRLQLQEGRALLENVMDYLGPVAECVPSPEECS